MQPKLMAWLDVINECRSYRDFVASNLNNSNNRQISIKRTALQIYKTVVSLFTNRRVLIKCLYTF